MGCSLSSLNLPCLKYQTQEDEVEQPKQYSWDKQKNIDVANYTIENLVDDEAGRLPGSISGQQFQVKNCKNSHIYLFDHSNTVTVDDCEKCKIFIGPVKGSVFVRDCSDCVIVIACGQFRTRDCRNIDTFLSVATQPIIEASTKVRVGCFQYWYPDLQQHFHSADLSPYNNNWWNVHDFTPVEGGKNWTTLGSMFKIHDFLPLPEGDWFRGLDISPSQEKSVVPLTTGVKRETEGDESCLVLVWDGEGRQEALEKLLKLVRTNHNVMIVRTRCVSLTPQDTTRIFQNYQKECERGPVVVVQLSGDGALGVGKEMGEGQVLASCNQEQANRDIQSFFNFADMQMNF